MFEKVLVPVDLSVNSSRTLRCLGQIPGIQQVEIVHVVFNRYSSEAVDPDDPDRKYIDLRLEEIRKRVELPGVAVKAMLKEIRGGEIFQAINRIAVQDGISLTLVGKRGRGIIDALILGSVASDVLRYGKTDLLLVDNKAMEDTTSGGQDLPCHDLFSHALICTDFSDPEIVSLCCDEMPWIRKVTLFHVVTTGDSTGEVRSLVDTAQAVLEKMQDSFTRIAIPVQIHVAIGSADEEIISFSEEEDISIIIIKSTGKRDFLLNLLGSTTARVARNTRKPVLVLRRSNGSK